MLVACPGCQARYDVTGRPAGTPARCRCGATFRLPEIQATSEHLSCPSCGAAAAANETRCRYCEAPLAPKICPACFGRVFAEARHCPHCGASVGEPGTPLATNGEGSRRCPRCSMKLETQLVSEVPLDGCPGCGGVFLDATALSRLVADRERQATLVASLAQTALQIDELAGKEQKVFYLKCPDCGRLMNRHNFGRRSGVIVDSCSGHGTWFDADELRRALLFVRAGGLERARQAHAEEVKRDTEARKRIHVDPSHSLERSEARTMWVAEGVVELVALLVGSLKD